MPSQSREGSAPTLFQPDPVASNTAADVSELDLSHKTDEGQSAVDSSSEQQQQQQRPSGSPLPWTSSRALLDAEAGNSAPPTPTRVPHRPNDTSSPCIQVIVGRMQGTVTASGVTSLCHWDIKLETGVIKALPKAPGCRDDDAFVANC